MFDVFTKLFQRSPPPNCDLLTDASPIASVAGIKSYVPLWRHQLAMLQRCIDIEKYNLKVKVLPTNSTQYKFVPEVQEYGIGIMNDPPGCGKTFVALALIALDKSATRNIIIVPPNLHHQWIKAAAEFVPFIKCVSVKEYKDTFECKDSRIIISTLFLADKLFAQEKDASRVKMHRVFVDEVDTSVNILQNIPHCNKVWFISASFDATEHERIGPFDLKHLTKSDILGLVCRCDLEFMQKYQPPLLSPNTEVIQVTDGDISLFKGFFDEHDQSLLNTLNFKKLKHKYAPDTNVSTLFDLSLYCIETLGAQLIELENEENSMKELEKQAIKRKKTMLERNIDVCAQNPQNMRTKLDEIDRICSTISPYDKWIIVSDDIDMFDLVEPIFTKHKCVNLTGGTLEKNEAAIEQYITNKDVQVLFLHSIVDGCGLNLENTTHILFLHYTQPSIVEQVIGRAQRPGRKGQLQIRCLYHDNENPLI